MPKNIVSIIFDPPVGTSNGRQYVTDFDFKLTATARFVQPPDVTDAQVDGWLTVMGARRNTESVPCNEAGTGKLRKIKIIRASGNTFTLPFALKANALALAGAVRNDLKDVAGNSVVCMQLIGEYFPHLNDELGLTYTSGQVATSHKAPITAKKQNYLSGTINYTSDVSGAIITNIRSITEKDTEDPAAQIESEWDGCTGGLINITACGNGRRNPRKHRRYIVEFATKLDPTDTNEKEQTESIEVPVQSDVNAEIFACGEKLAALQGAYCIGYRGESYDRVHKLLPPL